MLKIFASSAMLIATLTLPAIAQTSGTSPSPQTTAPNAQKSGAGVPGQPGNQSGPSPKSGDTTGAAGNSTTRQQDSSGVQGMPGNKSGPPARQPSQK